MKHQIYLILAAVMVLSGCVTSKIEDELKQREQELAEYNVDFTYQVIKDGKVKFTNTSDSRLTAKDFMWIFGEEAFAEKTYECTYTFEHSGTHKVTLQATLPSGVKKSVSHDVTVTIPGTPDPDPDPQPQPQTKTVYLKGFSFYSLADNSGYYKLTCTIKATSGKDVTVTTQQMQIKLSDLAAGPYNYFLSSPKLLTTSDVLTSQYSTVSVDLQQSSFGSWKTIYKSSQAVVKDKTNYYFVGSSGDIEFDVIFDYQ